MSAVTRLVLTEPLGFWGGLDPETGMIVAPGHPQCGESVAGRVLVLPGSCGSTSGPAILAEALRRGVGPVAIELAYPDETILAGVAVAEALYDVRCPIEIRSHDE